MLRWEKSFYKALIVGKVRKLTSYHGKPSFFGRCEYTITNMMLDLVNHPGGAPSAHNTYNAWGLELVSFDELRITAFDHI